MRHLIYIFILVFFLATEGTPAQAQTPQQQLRLHQADSIYKLHDSKAAVTKRNLKEAERELKSAQNQYKEAKAAHKEASRAAKEAKKMVKLEQKAIKARNKADAQSEAFNQ
ncbi:hypothetical protein [Pontibacter sp. H249]|uniref:hypothetical protein n=1 Tax=Pontibacter sp. H249 TaxID=3133420 RepID=UPI0030BF5F81